MTQEKVKNDRQLFMESEDGPPEDGMVYIASPYTHTDRMVVRARVKAAQAVAADIVNHGKGAFSPVLYTHTLLEATGVIPPNGWYQFDLHFLENAGEMLILELPGWEDSQGIMIEKAFAHGRRIPVVHVKLDQIGDLLDHETRAVLEQDARDRERLERERLEPK